MAQAWSGFNSETEDGVSAASTEEDEAKFWQRELSVRLAHAG